MLQLENSSVIELATEISGSIEVACRIHGQAGGGSLTILATKLMEDGKRLRPCRLRRHQHKHDCDWERCKCSPRTYVASPTPIPCRIRHSEISFTDNWPLTTALRRDLEDHTATRARAVAGAAVEGRAVNVSVGVQDERACRRSAIAAAGEIVDGLVHPPAVVRG